MHLGEPKMKKHFTLIVILSQLISALSFTGCQNTSQDPTTEVSTEPESTPPETTRDSLPDDLNYGGQTVTIFAASDLPIVEFDAEQTGDIVDDAIYQRNITVSERLNVDLNYILQPGLWADQDSYKGAIRGCVLSGDAEYDIVAGYGVFIADLAVEQLFMNLHDTAYIDFEQKWWSDSLIKNLSLNGKLYFASGDISTNTIGTSFAVLFNKELAEKYKLENLYSLVDNGKWTLDKLFELSSEVYTDLNGDGKRDENDLYGLVSHQTSFDNLYYSCCMNVVTPDKDKGMIVSPDFGSEKMASLVEKLCTAFNHTDGISWYTESGGEAEVNFKNGNSIFLLAGLDAASNSLRDANFNYGVLPTPKWDEAQENYLSTTTYTGSLYAIPLVVKDADMSSAVVEALAIEGYYTVAPAFFETALKIKYSSDDDSARMYDIIRDSRSYDFGRLFSTGGLESIPGKLRGMVERDNPNWMSEYESNITRLETLLAMLVEKLGK